MTEASAGLRKALARNAGVSKLTAEELLAQMTDEQKTALAATLAPAAAASEMPPKKDGEDEEDESEMGDKPKSKKKDDQYMDDDAKAKTATERAVAVMSSEHAAGRTKLAADLLANDKLSADDIIKVLAAMEPAAKADPEDAARAEMKAALEANRKSEIEANDGGAPKTEAKAADVWDAAYAKVFGTNNAA